MQPDFYNNYADNQGGSVYSVNESSLLIHDTDFEDNTAGFTGGLTASINCTVFLSNVHFIENKASEGGAIYISDFCHSTILNSSFEANAPTIYFKNSVSSNISGCRFFNNSSPLDLFSASAVNVKNSLFYYNHAQSGGVLFAFNVFNVSFYNCSFTLIYW